MRKSISTLKYILSLFVVLVALFVVGRPQAVAFAAGSDRIYYFNMDDKGLEGSMMLVESNGHWGLVDAGHRKATTIRDANGATYSTAVNGLSSQVYCRNGKDVANYMINTLGVRHLDFVVGTHAHSDHVGGIPEVAATSYKDASGVTRYLVDSNTTYYYKEYQHISDVEDDLVRYSSNSWHNQAFAYQAKTAMANQGANLVDVSKAQVVQGDPGNAYGDYVTFNVGNMSFRLYNVYEQTNTGNENVNSIVTVMTNGNYSVVNLSDINTNNAAIDKTSQAIAKDFGSVDVVVAGHHGYAGSNTKTMFDSLQPSFVVVPNGQESSWLYTDCDLAAAMPYAQILFGTAFYNTSISPYAVVTDLSGRQVYVYSVTGSGNLTNAINNTIKKTNKTGWVSWVQTNGTLWSYLEKGNSVKNAWRKVDGKMYHFDKTGIMQTGWLNDGGQMHYMDGSGALTTGWQLIGGKWYYFEPKYGNLVKNSWQKVNGKMYYFNGDGVMQTGWLNYGGQMHYMDGSGALTTGWQLIGGKWYYFEASHGNMLKNCWQKINGKMYFFHTDGVMHTGWLEDGGNMHYMDDSGALTIGRKQIDGKWYYFEPKYGNLVRNCWQRSNGKSYYINSEGVAHTGWLNYGGEMHYMDSTGALTVGWQQIEGKWYFFEAKYGNMVRNTWQKDKGKMYYLGSDGVMVTGWMEDGGNKHYMDGSGALTVGWKQIDGKWYYFEPKYGNLQNQTGWQKINGRMYYFDSNGVMHTGWLNDGGNMHYMDGSGAMAIGWQQIDGRWYFFESQYGNMVKNTWQKDKGKMYYLGNDGAMHTGWMEDGGNKHFMDGSGAMVTGWQAIGGSWYYFESQYGNMLTGWQQLNNKWYYFYPDGRMAVDTVIEGYYVNKDGIWAA